MTDDRTAPGSGDVGDPEAAGNGAPESAEGVEDGPEDAGKGPGDGGDGGEGGEGADGDDGDDGDDAGSPGPSALDAVEEGPREAVEDGVPALAAPDGVAPHPSVEALLARFGDAVVGHGVSAGDQHVVRIDPARVAEVLGWLKDDEEHRYDLLVDVTAVDYGGGRPLEVVYQLWSIPHRRQLRVKAELPLSNLQIASVAPLWKTADWLEREVYDLFGIEFEGHPDLRRILMPENYAEGHPLRKDFPLRGRFSRAEQTRRALSQDPHDYYIPMEFDIGREPQMAEGTPPERPELPQEGGGR